MNRNSNDDNDFDCETVTNIKKVIMDKMFSSDILLIKQSEITSSFRFYMIKDRLSQNFRRKTIQRDDLVTSNKIVSMYHDDDQLIRFESNYSASIKLAIISSARTFIMDKSKKKR